MSGYDQSVDQEVNKMVDGDMKRLGHEFKMTSEGNFNMAILITNDLKSQKLEEVI